MCLGVVINLSEFQFSDLKGNIITTFIRSGSLEKGSEILRFVYRGTLGEWFHCPRG